MWAIVLGTIVAGSSLMIVGAVGALIWAFSPVRGTGDPNATRTMNSPVTQEGETRTNSGTNAAASNPVVTATKPGATEVFLPSTMTPAANSQSDLQYRPKVDSIHHYEIEINSQHDGFNRRYHGNCDFTTKSEVKAGFSVGKTSVDSSGTGFVVGSNGIIVTCAHVVAGAGSISAIVGAKTYPATVIHSDPVVDVAVIKIDAKNLSVVHVAEGARPEIGQPLRVIGFPLTDVLGEHAKFTQGTVSGVVQQEGRELLQTDATINPGNSGGPVFDSRGEVIGVASAKLAGTTISQVGFCVPATSLRANLLERGIVLPSPPTAVEIATPALVAKTKPAVALLKIKSGHSDYKSMAFDYSGFLYPSDTRPSGMPIINIGLGSEGIHEFGDLTLTEHGVPTNISAGESVPMLLTRLPMLPFAELPGDSRSEWSTYLEFAIVREERPRSPLGLGRLLPDDILSGRRRTPQPTTPVQKATIKDSYRLDTSTAEKHVCKRTFEFKTLDGEPSIELSGEGQWTFDRRVGMPAASELKGFFRVTNKGVTVNIPYTMKLRRFTDEERLAFDEKFQKNRKSESTTEKDAPSKNPSAEKKGDATFTIDAARREFRAVAISRSSKAVAFIEYEKGLFIHDLTTGNKIASDTSIQFSDEDCPLSYSPDGKFLLATSYGGIIHVWSVDEKDQIEYVANFVGHSKKIKALHIMPDNRTVISIDEEKRLRVWGLNDQKEIRSQLLDKVDFFAFGNSSDLSSILFATRSDKSLFSRLLLSDGTISRLPRAGSSADRSVVFSSDGKQAFITDGDDLQVIDVENGNDLAKVDTGESLRCVAHCEKTNEAFVGGSGKIHVIDVTKATRTAILNQGDGSESVEELAVSQDGRFVVAIGGSGRMTLMVFDREAPKK